MPFLHAHQRPSTAGFTLWLPACQREAGNHRRYSKCQSQSTLSSATPVRHAALSHQRKTRLTTWFEDAGTRDQEWSWQQHHDLALLPVPSFHICLFFFFTVRASLLLCFNRENNYTWVCPDQVFLHSCRRRSVISIHYCFLSVCWWKPGQRSQ